MGADPFDRDRVGNWLSPSRVGEPLRRFIPFAVQSGNLALVTGQRGFRRIARRCNAIAHLACRWDDGRKRF
jgi:hypothetical protein